MRRNLRVASFVFACGLLSSAAWAQQASGIVGVVKDTSGGVLPGVTVEASSPALIEKVRTAVTDERGQYRVIDLVPGTYSITFTLPGFAAVKREGVVLTSGFTATIDANMQVGAVTETVTVTGASPLVDTQNVRQQQIVSGETLEVLPVKSVGTAVLTLTPGLNQNPVGTNASTYSADVGGSAGLRNGNTLHAATFHGKFGIRTLFDGMQYNPVQFTGVVPGYIPNTAIVEEVVVEQGGGLGETISGVAVNVVPKAGGNTFRGNVVGLFSNREMQSTNLSDKLRARGLTRVNRIHKIYDTYATVGGPIKKDRVWFFVGVRNQYDKLDSGPFYYNLTQGTPFYTPDLARPAYTEGYDRPVVPPTRLTWQVSPRNKVNALTAVDHVCVCPNQGANAAPEAIFGHLDTLQLHQATWSSPVSNRLLLEAGASVAGFANPFHNPSVEGLVGPDDISITELSTGFQYNALAAFNGFGGSYGTRRDDFRYVQRFSLSYVTGSHAFKAGVYLSEGWQDLDQLINGPLPISYNFLRGVPVAVVQYATPYLSHHTLNGDHAVFAQDQWRLNRVTLSMGLRFDYFNASVPAQHHAAGPFVPERTFAAVKDVPSWTDLNPRVGVSYDLFGTGRTALKVSFGRYVNSAGTGTVTSGNDPLITSVNSVTRTWTDRNGSYAPDCDLTSPSANGECGAFQNLNFGRTRITTRYADDVISGFGVRSGFWDFGTELHHEVLSGLSVSAGYYRNSQFNFLATDNQDVSPSDFSTYCITAPTDARLPGSGGYQVCGLYDIAPRLLGVASNLLVTQASNFGDPKQTNDFVSLNFASRFGGGIRLGGGIDAGRTITDNCYVVDSPQQLLNCRTEIGFGEQLQVKLFGSYPLPGDFVVSGTLQESPGPAITANYVARNAEIAPSLGRNLATGPNGFAVVPLIEPFTEWEGRRVQLDLRLTKAFTFNNGMRLRGNVDLYNALNASPVTALNGNYGPAWRNALVILPARLLQVGGELTF